MAMTMKSTIVMGVMLIGSSLSACSKQAEGDDPFDGSASATGAQLGARDAYRNGRGSRVDPKAEPVTVKPGDLPPVSDTAEPVPID